MPALSVIICTHNKAGSLARAIDSVLASELHDLELLIVDNASTDATRAVVEGRSESRLRYVREDRLSLQHARHAGVRAAETDLLLFTDDDATVDRGWAGAHHRTFAAHPDLAAAGGPVRPVWEAPPPAWLLRLIGEGKSFPPLALMEPFDRLTIGPEAFFFGVNMALRRRALREHGGFRPDLIGARTIGSGEWGLLLGLRAAGAELAYVPDAVVRHHIPAWRTTPAFLRRWAWHGNASDMYERWRGRRRTPLALAAELGRIARSHWRDWLLQPFASSREEDGIQRQVRASAGLSELTYLWWMLTDDEVRAALDAESFGP